MLSSRLLQVTQLAARCLQLHWESTRHEVNEEHMGILASMGGQFARRMAARQIAKRLGWRTVPLLGIGVAAFWTFRAWQRRANQRSEAKTLNQLPAKEPKAPLDPVDESSWESFPASDPPAVSPPSRAAKSVS